MKSIFLLPMLSFCILLSCKAQQKVLSGTTLPPVTQSKPAPAALLQWDKKMVDLGAVKRGEKRELFYEFTNTSGRELQIDIVDACQCTEVEFPRGIIAPGEKKRLDVTFDSTEKEKEETIDIRVIFKQNDEKGNPLIEIIQYKFTIAP